MHIDQVCLNRVIYILCKIIISIIDSVAESEIATAYANAQEAIPIRHVLEELNHFQPATLI